MLSITLVLILTPYMQAVAAQSRSLVHILALPHPSGDVSSSSTDTIEATLCTSFQNLIRLQGTRALDP